MTSVKPIPVDPVELRDAFEFVSSGDLYANRAYISRDTGKIHWLSEAIEPDEDVPDDLEESDRYIAIPHKTDLDLGRNLALSFIGEELSDDLATVAGFFQRKGAYARFKDLLARRGMLDKWYSYEDHATEQALRYWCEENGIQLLEQQRG
jgi:Uncharacterised protein family (UPF0158)